MYSIINFSVWLQLVGDLFEIDGLLSPHKKRWNKISKRIRKIKDQRDQLAHHPVIPDPNSIRGLGLGAALQAPKFDTRTKTKRQLPLDAKEVADLCEKILLITVDLVELTEAMVATVETSLEKPA